MEGEGNNNKIRRLLFNEISFALAIVGASFSAFIWFSGIPQENKTNIRVLEQLVKIQQNDLHSLNAGQEEIKKEIRELRDVVIELRTEIKKFR